MITESASRTPANDDRAATIYRTAARIFNQKGYHATSINEIAEAVQLTKAGLYYYIKGKQDLLFAIMSFAMDRLETEVVAKAREEPDPEARLRSIVERHARLITEDSSALTILVDELEGLTPDHRERIIERQRAYVDFVRRTLGELRRGGRLEDLDPTVASFALLGSVLWISRWFRPDGRLSGERVVEEIGKFVLGGVGLG